MIIIGARTTEIKREVSEERIGWEKALRKDRAVEPMMKITSR